MNSVIIRYKALKGSNFSIYLDYTVDGIRKYEFLKLRVSKDYSKNKGVTEKDKDALTLAETIRAKRQSELYHSKTFDTSVKQVNRFLFDYIDAFHKQTNRKQYGYLLKHLKIFSRKSPLLSEINPIFINSFTEHLLKKVSRNTTRMYIGTFCMFINKAFREGLLSENPCKKIKPLPRTQTERSFLSLEELKSLAENTCLVNEQTEQAFLFSCFTGLRFSDVKALKVSDIHKEINKNGKVSEYILIRPQKTSKTTGKLLKIPLSEQALLIIKAIKRVKVNDSVFDNLPSKYTVNRSLKRWANNAGINKNLHFHVGRHTFASLSLSYGIDIYAVSKLLGHSNVKTTSIYANLTDDKKQREVEKFPMFKNLKKIK